MCNYETSDNNGEWNSQENFPIKEVMVKWYTWDVINIVYENANKNSVESLKN